LPAYTFEATRLYPALRPDLLARLPDRLGRVLDVGCGAGVFGQELVAEGRADEVWGVDLSPDAVSEAGHRLAVAKVLDLDRERVPFQRASFDTLIYGDVLEHLKFPWITLRDQRPLLRAGGRVFCSTPNIGHRTAISRLLRQRWDYETEGLFDYTHLRFFTRGSVEAMFRSAGFQTVKVESLHPTSRKAWLFNLLTLGRLRDLNVSSFWIEAHV
jgi:SAM-dependent methyltransferase